MALRTSSLSKDIPTFVFFITDGDNFDQNQTESFIKAVSKYPIFWQFVGIGRERFSFLSRLDDLPGRYIDNANFFKIDDLSSIADEQLYEKLLNEFPSWLKEVKRKGMLSQ